MSDQILRAKSTDGFVKAVAINSKNIVERARSIHNTTPTATAALGRVLTACAMLGNMQKIENGSVTLQIKGGGPLGTILAVSDAEGNVRQAEGPLADEMYEKYGDWETVLTKAFSPNAAMDACPIGWADAASVDWYYDCGSDDYGHRGNEEDLVVFFAGRKIRDQFFVDLSDGI